MNGLRYFLFFEQKIMSEAKKNKRRTNKRVTLEDIARLGNVSRASVGQVLNRHATDFPLSAAMIERVEAAAEELGYRPNRLARSLSRAQTHLIALSHIHIDYQNLTPDQITYENQAIGQFAKSIFRHAEFEDYDLVIHERRESKDALLKASDFKTDLFDGMIYLTPSDVHTEFLDVASPDFPIILLGELAGAEKKIPCIDMNNRKMAKQAVQYLIDQDCRNILMLIPEKLQDINCIKDRCLGYQDALRENAIGVNEEFICTVRCLKEDINTFFEKLPFLDEIDAVFCAIDDLAVLCIDSVKALGYHIPEDVSLMGFSDAPFSQYTNPPLSTVRVPVEAQAHAAIDLLLKALKDKAAYEPGFHEIDAELVIRESTAGVKQAN